MTRNSQVLKRKQSGLMDREVYEVVEQSIDVAFEQQKFQLKLYDYQASFFPRTYFQKIREFLNFEVLVMP